jgi:hypothetical protein
LIAVKYFCEELPLASARHAKLLYFADRSDEVALVVAIALASPERCALARSGPNMRGHLFFKDLLNDGFDAFTNASFNILMNSLSEFSSVIFILQD